MNVTEWREPGAAAPVPRDRQGTQVRRLPGPGRRLPAGRGFTQLSRGGGRPPVFPHFLVGGGVSLGNWLVLGARWIFRLFVRSTGLATNLERR